MNEEKILDSIIQTNDIKKLPSEKLPMLAEEIRQFLIEKISMTGGHLGSNLGAVELTMALHLALNLPEDKIIWDVGHQSYTHKLLTGRKEGFDSLRKYGGMSGFPKRKESSCDCFDTGHSSTSISAGLGLVKARDLRGEKNTIVSVIGDGSLTGGMAYEALNNAAKLETNFIIVLNDNNMSISENVGGVSKYLNNIRTAKSYLNLKEDIYNKLRAGKHGGAAVTAIRRAKSSLKHLVVPGMFFEDMGITYLGPVDGHNIQDMLRAFNEAKRFKKAVLLHVITEKGKGYEPAVHYPARFHGTDPFEIETGLPKKPKNKPSYTDVFSSALCKLGEKNPDIVAITAAMPDGTGMKRFKSRFPERFFDVGIAEEHAVTFAAGLAAGGLRPVVAIYSSFLQRAYDQIIHDVCLQQLPVIFAVDRAGLVGSDGETHQGIFDLSYLSGIPGLTIMAPKNKWELSDMINYAAEYDGPCAIRYPRGEAFDGLGEFRARIEAGKAEWIYKGEKIALLAVGSMVEVACKVKELLEEEGYHPAVVNMRFVRPLDESLLEQVAKEYDLVVTLEENVMSGGFGEHVGAYLENEKQLDVMHVAIPDVYVEHGSVDILKQDLGLDAKSIAEAIIKRMK